MELKRRFKPPSDLHDFWHTWQTSDAHRYDLSLVGMCDFSRGILVPTLLRELGLHKEQGNNDSSARSKSSMIPFLAAL